MIPGSSVIRYVPSVLKDVFVDLINAQPAYKTQVKLNSDFHSYLMAFLRV